MLNVNGFLFSFFLIAALIAFLVPFIRNRLQTEIRIGLPLTELKFIASLIIPFLLLYSVGSVYHVQAAAGLLYFIASAFLSWGLFQINLPATQRGMLLLLASVLLTRFIPGDETAHAILLSWLAGLLIWKTAENLSFQAIPVWEDIVFPLTWLAGIYWIGLSSAESTLTLHQGLLLGSMAIALLLYVLQALPFKLDKTIFMKPLLIAVIGTLAEVFLINNILLSPALLSWAWLFGGGILLAALLGALNQTEQETLEVPQAIMALALIGLGTLVASRLFGSLGWIVLASLAIVFPARRHVAYAALFWIVRTLLQGFILTNNPNVTGINLVHPYSSAALYGGIMLVLILPVILQKQNCRLFLPLAFLLSATLLPMGTHYFFHAEPSASFMIASVVTALVVVLGSPFLYRVKTSIQEAMLLFAAQLVTAGLLSSELLDLGTAATKNQKLQVLAVIVVLIALLGFWTQRKLSGTQPVNITGD